MQVEDARNVAAGGGPESVDQRVAVKKLKIANVIEDGRVAGPQVRMVRVAVQLAGRVETTIIMPSEGSQIFQQRCARLDIPYKTLG